MQHALLLLVLPAFAACAGPAPRTGELPASHATFPVHYEARVAGLSPDGAAPPSTVAEFSAETPHPEADPRIAIDCELVRMDEGTAHALLGWSPAEGLAHATDLARIREILDAGRASGRIEQVSAPRLVLFDGQRGSISISNQTAYVSHYELQVANGIAVADPVVQVASDGMLLELVPRLRPAESTVALEVEIVLSALRHPFPSIETVMPGSGVPVTIQQPVCCTQKLSTAAPLAPSECLVVAAFDGDEADGRLFAVLSARGIAPSAGTASPTEGAAGPR